MTAYKKEKKKITKCTYKSILKTILVVLAIEAGTWFQSIDIWGIKEH